MFASIALATRIERAETRLTHSLAGTVMMTLPESRAFIEPIGGGVAAYAGPSSPMNKMIGVGFDGVPPAHRLQQIEDRFRERNEPLQAEVSTLADPAFAAELSTRGYVLRNFENVSARAIVAADHEPPKPEDIRIDLMTATNAGEWIDAAVTGFLHADGEGVQSNELPPRDELDRALRPFAMADGLRRYCAWIDGQLAGVASLRIDDGVAQLCGATTLPTFRRRGVQAALLRCRLADGARSGCDIAVLTTQPGSTSQSNSHRQGFALLYARALLVKSVTS